MDTSSSITLKIPKQDLAALSFCKPDPASFSAWAHHLPVANLGETSRLLHQAITELNRLPLSPEVRLELLELLRSHIYHAVRGLAKHYMNQPIVLPPRARNVAQLAQVLQNELAIGYTITVSQAHSLKLSFRRQGHGIGDALHRAITDFSQVLLRSFLLFQPAPHGLWHSLHQLHLFAIQEGVVDTAIADPLVPSPEPLTIRQAYLRALLLGSARVNQLRQHDLRHVAQALGEWCRVARLIPCTAGFEGLVVQPAADAAPLYRQFADTSRHPAQYGIDTQALVAQLKAAVADDTVEAVHVNGVDIADNLLQHLATAWGELAERNFTRTDDQQQLDICFGLSAVHHYLSDGQSFEDLMGTARAAAGLLDDTEKNPFLRNKAGSGPKAGSDLWDSPFKMQFSGDAASKLKTLDQQVSQHAQQARASEAGERFQVARLETFNTSPGGYGLNWQGEPPALLKAGEVVGVRASADDHWAVAAIRWVKPGDEVTQFGIEILSAVAQPWGGRAVRKVGEAGDFLRVLLLPEVDAVGMPASLLTPRVGFRTRQKVVLQQKGDVQQVRLSRKLDGTGAWCRFAFDTIGGSPSQAPADTAKGAEPLALQGFDSLWKSL